MAWNPDTYNKFKSERSLPFYDLLSLVKTRPHMDVIDLGCGTGELTRKLADALPDAQVLGIDSSPEMLNNSQAFAQKNLAFEHRSIEEQLDKDATWDLVFSNAAIQWVNNHETLLPKIISKIRPGGQLAVQLPAQPQNISNKLLHELAGEMPFSADLQHWDRTSPVLDTDAYAQILFAHGSRSMTVYEKIYPLILEDANALFDWVSGTALLPYMEKLQEEYRTEFIAAYKKHLQERFKGSPVFYPFKRIILEGTF